MTWSRISEDSLRLSSFRFAQYDSRVNGSSGSHPLNVIFLLMLESLVSSYSLFETYQRKSCWSYSLSRPIMVTVFNYISKLKMHTPCNFCAYFRNKIWVKKSVNLMLLFYRDWVLNYFWTKILLQKLKVEKTYLLLLSFFELLL